MSHEIDLSIIVCSFNTRDDTLACLESIAADSAGLRVEVIVIDNASHDGSADAIAAHCPWVHLIALTHNLGFAAANNLAAEHASGEYLLLLNPDTILLKGALHNILEFAKIYPHAGIYGGRTYFSDMSLNRTSCHGAPTLWSQLCKGTGLSSVFPNIALFNPEGLGGWERDTIREVDCITGCFLLIRRSLWEQLGGFDLDFFMYGEDTDLCIRARKLGAHPHVCPDARLIHHGGRSEAVRADKLVRLFRAKHLLFAKHWHPWAVCIGVLMLATWALTRYLAFTLLSFVCPRYRTTASEWKTVLERRKEFTTLETFQLTNA